MALQQNAMVLPASEGDIGQRLKEWFARLGGPWSGTARREPLSKPAVSRASERAHEIIQLLQRERFAQHRRPGDKSIVLFRILPEQIFNEFCAPTTGAAHKCHSDQNQIIGPVGAVDAERLIAA